MNEFKEIEIKLSPKLKTSYSTAVFGKLAVRDVPNRKKHNELESKKRDLEKMIREVYPEVDEDTTIRGYDTYFKKWGKTYPIAFQIKTIKEGGHFPQVSILVDSMFLAELKTRILTSGHDLDTIQGELIFDVSEGGERYMKINGKEQTLKDNDVILKDGDEILASVLYGPARKTSITPSTQNVLYFAWCPYGAREELITEHLSEILANLYVVFESTSSKIHIYQE
ncbi:MAG: phenylalanine--tRNA ligase beta subunit-related protein [Candidatus Thorarchaeota archaeon]